MKAIILAAGYATRLYPLTLDRPKPLLEVGDKLMIEHTIHKLDEVPEIDEIHVVTNDKFYNRFNEWKEGFSSKKKLMIHNDGTTSNDDRLGAVGDMHFVIEKEEIDDDVLIIAGDNLFELSLNSVVGSFRDHGHSIVAARDLKDKSLLAERLGVILTDEHSIVTDFEEKPKEPKSTLAATAIYMFNKSGVSELKRLISENAKLDNSGDLVRHLSSKSKVYCYQFDSRWFDVGSHEQLKEADEYIKNKGLKG